MTKTQVKSIYQNCIQDTVDSFDDMCLCKIIFLSEVYLTIKNEIRQHIAFIAFKIISEKLPSIIGYCKEKYQIFCTIDPQNLFIYICDICK